MASPRDPQLARTLGFAGSLLLTAGGLASGALPTAPLLLRPPATIGLISAYLGLALLIGGWWRLGRALPLPPAYLLGTLAWWSGPLALGAPLFSRDVYSYLAQGAMVHAGLDVYRQGPADLGGPLAAGVPALWQHTPTPYGPVFLLFVAGVAGLAGTHVLAGVLALRLVALAGVAGLAWLTPRIAAHCGVPADRALWLGVLNPLVLLHLVAGAHNDAVMLAGLGAGLYAALTGRMVVGTALITAAALVKAPAALGLLVVAVLWAQRHRAALWAQRHRAALRAQPQQLWTHRRRARRERAATVPAPPAGRQRGQLLAAARAVFATGIVAIAATVLLTWVVGTGYGWIGALRTPVSATNWSVTGVLGRITHTALAEMDGRRAYRLAQLAVPAWRWLGLSAVAAIPVLAWWVARRQTAPGRSGQANPRPGGRTGGVLEHPGPVWALGLGLAALALLGPATRPWYLLWGVIPLAVSAPPGLVRRLTAVASALLAVVVLPSGYPPGREDLALAGLGLLLGVLVLRFVRPAEQVGVPAWVGRG